MAEISMNLSAVDSPKTNLSPINHVHKKVRLNWWENAEGKWSWWNRVSSVLFTLKLSTTVLSEEDSSEGPVQPRAYLAAGELV